VSNLTDVMLCKHTKTKQKLVILAQRSRYGHFQGYAMRECCIYCGASVGYDLPTVKLERVKGAKDD